MNPARILVVEDEADQRELVGALLRADGHAVVEASGLAPARHALAEGSVDLVLCDWQLGDGVGGTLLDEIRARTVDPGSSSTNVPAFVVVTAYGTIARAVEAIRQGADDYLAKPFERQALRLAIARALRARHLIDENRRLTEALGERDRLVDLVGRAPSMQRLYRQVEKLATTDATVLLGGESGTGKELAARALHALSGRRDCPFVAVNCAAIPEGLLESEFFGVAKGAFTGADRSRAGKIDQADGGTLFLDEVAELPLALQPKLLRVLQEGTYSRVGDTEERRADLRVIAASHRDLASEVSARRFREDLYYRLAVVPIEMPPLRDRRDDIPRLVEHFAARAERRHGRSLRPFPAAVLRRLLDHPWPGNVRELSNVVERLVLLADDGHVSVDDLPGMPAPSTDGGFALPAEGLDWSAHERNCLQQALERAGGNRAEAARLLALPYKAFLYRLDKHGLETHGLGKHGLDKHGLGKHRQGT